MRMLTLINMGFHCFDYFASLLLNPLDILLVFDFGLFSLHLVSDLFQGISVQLLESVFDGFLLVFVPFCHLFYLL